MSKLLAVVAVAAAFFYAVVVPSGPTETPSPALQRVWVEVDGQTVWEVVCVETFEPRECLQESLAGDLLGAGKAVTTAFDDAVIPTGAAFVVGTEPWHAE